MIKNSLIRNSLTGPQLKALRRAQRINQTDMGQLIGCSRHAVSYWETKPNRINTGHGVPARMLKVLGVTTLLPNWGLMPEGAGSYAKELL